MCAIYNGGALWWAIYSIQTVHQSDTSDWLLIYRVYITADACVHRHITVNDIHKIGSNCVSHVDILSINVETF